ncbi:hypothetical protein L208DRAFT_1450616 [Tricholoma matsutake]|nr:hypothetical protein L208DRAFT_1450616 [Tricholoma matsutake 945]
MISAASHTAQSERPERSRNAKAQARHRAKRKAYIEQLEQTVTKLQTSLNLTPEEVAALPPPLLRIRELEQENAKLEKENEELRRMLSVSDLGNRGLPMDMSRRSSPSAFSDARLCDRDFKRRKMGGGVEGLYVSGDSISRPPPLMIPQSVSHNYSQISSSASHHSVNGSSMYNLHAPAFQMPDTPSGSSATSSPPFSASPTQMQEPLHSSVNHRSSISQNPVISHYTTQRAHHQYAGGVKVEDEHYANLRHQQSHDDGHYPLHTSYNNGSASGMDWHAYSERAHIHR